MVQNVLSKGIRLSTSNGSLFAEKCGYAESFGVKIPFKALCGGLNHYSQIISKIKDYVLGNPDERISLIITPEAYDLIKAVCNSNQSTIF